MVIRNGGVAVRGFIVAFVLLLLQVCVSVSGEVVITGRLFASRFEGSAETVPMTAVRCFASLDGPGSQALGFRTWEMQPAGWYFLSGSAGKYTLTFSTPAHLMRPIVMTNIYTQPGDRVDRVILPHFDYAVFYDGAWDEKAATDYYQTFVAKGTSVTHVGFRPVHDGVDGGGPGSQNMVLSVHKRGDGTPDTWKQVGPAIVVQNVDCGGPKGYTFSAGWNSGEVPTTPGEVYAAHLTVEKEGGQLQTFWRPNEETKTDCYRIGADGKAGWAKAEMWMAIGSDCDGLVIPYNKRVHKEYVEFAGGAMRWSQTYVAQGRSMASVILYAAVSGRQPSQNRQRLAVRVRKNDPRGDVVGVEKIAIGNANYTGDASWGTFGLSYAPGEVPLIPGETYAIEFESLENWETLHDYVDIKNHPPDPNPGFNPYRKMPPDDYPLGKSFRDGEHEQDFDLDMQVIEYAFAVEDWDKQVTGKNLLANGDMEAGELDPEDPAASKAEAWVPFETEEATVHQYLLDGKEKDNRILRIFGGGATGKPVDGGYVQRVEGLSQLETYRLSGQLRSSWWIDEKHACYVGCDPTGQADDPKADTIVWQTLPKVHGIFVPFLSEPIRPKKDAISVWLRGWTSLTVDMPFEADFDDFELRQVETKPALPTDRKRTF